MEKNEELLKIRELQEILINKTKDISQISKMPVGYYCKVLVALSSAIIEIDKIKH